MDAKTRERIRRKKADRHAHDTALWFNLPADYVEQTTVYHTDGRVTTMPTRDFLREHPSGKP